MDEGGHAAALQNLVIRIESRAKRIDRLASAALAQNVGGDPGGRELAVLDLVDQRARGLLAEVDVAQRPDRSQSHVQSRRVELLPDLFLAHRRSDALECAQIPDRPRAVLTAA